MQARIFNINRSRERLLTTAEVANRLELSRYSALEFMRVHGIRVTGKGKGRYYITEEKLHLVLAEQGRL